MGCGCKNLPENCRISWWASKLVETSPRCWRAQGSFPYQDHKRCVRCCGQVFGRGNQWRAGDEHEQRWSIVVRCNWCLQWGSRKMASSPNRGRPTRSEHNDGEWWFSGRYQQTGSRTRRSQSCMASPHQTWRYTTSFEPACIDICFEVWLLFFPSGQAHETLETGPPTCTTCDGLHPDECQDTPGTRKIAMQLWSSLVMLVWTYAAYPVENQSWWGGQGWSHQIPKTSDFESCYAETFRGDCPGTNSCEKPEVASKAGWHSRLRRSQHDLRVEDLDSMLNKNVL